MSKVKVMIALILALVLYVVAAYCYALVKPIWCDETWMFIPCANLAFEGFMGMGDQTTLLGPTLHSNMHMYWHPPLGYWSTASWMWLWGEGWASVFIIRLHTIIWGVVLLLGLASLMRNYHRYAAVWAVIFCALDYNFLLTSDARPDIMCAALGIWAITLKSEWLAGASMMVHPFGCMYAIYLAIAKRRFNWIPYAVMACMWGVYIVQEPKVWWNAFIMNWWMHIYQATGAESNGEMAAYMGYAFGWRWVLIGTYLACVWLNRKDRMLSLMFLLFVVPAFMIVHSVNYFPHAIPFLAMGVAVQMKRFPWLAGLMAFELVFAVTSLFPLWTWDGVFVLR